MTVLAIDTSARGRSVAVVTALDGTLIGHRVADDVASIGALIAGLSALLAEHGPGLEAVVVAAGPGAYTGVRAGMAAALGVAQSAGRPLHGIGSLEVVAHGAPAGLAAGTAVSAAGRDAVYVARFTRPGGTLRVEDPIRLSAEGWAAQRAATGTVVSFDGELAGITAVIAPHRALAAAVPAALSRPALGLDGLAARHVAAGSAPW